MDILEARTLVTAYFLSSLGLGTAQAVNERGAIVGAVVDKPVVWGAPYAPFLSARDGISLGVNDRMQVVGQLKLSPFIYDGDMHALDGVGAAYAINDAGVVVGTSMKGLVSVPTVWTPEQTQLSDSPGTIRSINDAGQYVGDVGGMAAIWDAENVAELFPGSASDINESGVVVGESDGRAVMWTQDGGVTDLGVPNCFDGEPANRIGEAVGINDAGQIVGNFSCPVHAWGTWTPLMYLIYGYSGGAFPTTVKDINNAGTIVGDSHPQGGPDKAFVMTIWEFYMDSLTGREVAERQAWWKGE